MPTKRPETELDHPQVDDAILSTVALAAGLLAIASAVVHGATFFGIDPMWRFPYVMWIHVFVIVVFAGGLYAARRVLPMKHNAAEQIWHSAPQWLQILSVAAFAYAGFNFAMFFVLSEGGSPQQKGGKFLLTNHGRVIRTLTEQEFHQQQAYVARGFSGHWVLFSVAAMTIAVGARRYCHSPEKSKLASDDELRHLARTANLQQETAATPISLQSATVQLIAYTASIGMILSGEPVFAATAAVIAATLMIRVIPRMRCRPRKSFESWLGWVSLIPNALLASKMGNLAAQFLYVNWYAGLSAAVFSEIQMQFPVDGPLQLSNGELVHTRVWSALMILVQFPLFAFGAIGLTYTLDSAAIAFKSVGRYTSNRLDA